MNESEQTLINQSLKNVEINTIEQIDIQNLKNQIFSLIGLLPKQVAYYTPRPYIFQSPNKYITEINLGQKIVYKKVPICYFNYFLPAWDILSIITSLVLLIMPIIHGYYKEKILQIVSLAIDAGLLIISLIFLIIILKKFEIKKKTKFLFITYIIEFVADIYIKLEIFSDTNDELLIMLTFAFQYIFLLLLIISFCLHNLEKK